VGLPALALHTSAVPAALQTLVPLRRHTPCPALHAVPSPVKVSSVLPLQSSSSALHFSADGATLRVQVTVDAKPLLERVYAMMHLEPRSPFASNLQMAIDDVLHPVGGSAGG
jgi:hypothetical protein